MQCFAMCFYNNAVVRYLGPYHLPPDNMKSVTQIIGKLLLNIGVKFLSENIYF